MENIVDLQIEQLMLDIPQENSNIGYKFAVLLSGIDQQNQALIIDGICEACEELSCHALFFYALTDQSISGNSDDCEMRIFELANLDNVDAVIVFAQTLRSEFWHGVVEAAQKAGKPVVLLDEEFDNCCSVFRDYENAIEVIVDHLIKVHGCRKINFLAGFPDNPVSDSRLNSFKKALSDNGIPYESKRTAYGWFWFDQASQEVEKFMESNDKPEAIVCANDVMALATCIKLSQLGYKVPDDVIVTGLDGIREAMEFFPKITTAHPDSFSAGKLLAQRAKEMLDKTNPPHRTDIPLEFVFTESCGCAEILHENNNTVLHTLFEELSSSTNYANHFIELSEKMTGCTSLEEAADLLEETVKRAWCRRIWVCVCEDFIKHHISDIREIAIKNRSADNGYSKKMKAFIYVENHVRLDYPDFETRKLLNDLDNELVVSDSIMFFPMHYQGQTIGYLAMDYRPPTGNFNLLRTWISTISGILKNVSIQQEMASYADEIKNLYMYDFLTGLCNRRAFYHRFNGAIRNLPAKTKIMTISVDLDGLKPINDIFGHQEGDNAISQVAQALKNSANNGEICSRFGGDEFIVVGVNCNEEFAAEYIKRTNQYIENYNIIAQKPYKISISYGIYVSSFDSGETIDQRITLADKQMYNDKKRKKRLRSAPRSDER